MSSSDSILGDIVSALRGLQFLGKRSSDWVPWGMSSSVNSRLDALQPKAKNISLSIGKLRLVETFIKCSTTWLGSETVILTIEEKNAVRELILVSLLERIQAAVCSFRGSINRSVDELRRGGSPSTLHYHVDEFIAAMESSFEQEMEVLYVILAEPHRQPTFIQVRNRACPVLKNLEDFLLLQVPGVYALQDSVQALLESMEFLRNFMRFAILRAGDDDEPPEDLLHLSTHFGALPVKAELIALRLFSPATYNSKTRLPSFIETTKRMISDFQRQMKPVDDDDSKVCETYIRALASLKRSSREEVHFSTLTLHDDVPTIILMDFISSLLCYLWEILQSDSVLVVSLKDQLQALYEGLRSLRTSLKEQPNKFVDVQIRDIVGLVICDSGVVIFSLVHKGTEIDLGIPDLLENITVIRKQVEEGQVPVTTSKFNFPKTNVLGFLDFLLENLLKVTIYEVDSDTQSCIQTLGEYLVFVRSFLGVLAELKSQQEQHLQALYNQTLEVAYNMEFLVDQLVLGDIQESFSVSFASIKEDIRMIKDDVMKILHSTSRRQPFQLQRATWTPVPSSSQQTSTTATEGEVVGFEMETATIINRLTRGSKKLQVVAIVGMPGSGKTTLGKKVYNDPSVMSHFHVRAWCSISQVLNRKEVLLTLLSQTLGKRPDGYHKTAEDDLVQELWRSLKRRRFLIFLDDVWDIKSFDCLKGSFPDDSTESRILLTSRQCDAAPEAMLDDKPHFLRSLATNECLELLRRKLFPGKDYWPKSLHEFGMEIAEACKGLPLTTVLVAGILSSTKQASWNEVLQSLRSGIISSTEQCNNTMELSYRHLPDHLKPCLLLFGAFPEDQEVSVKRLIWYWIAEGFVRESKSKSLEEVATDYLKILIGRSLVMEAKKSSRGGVKSCNTHDLLRGFYVKKAKEEDLFRVLEGYDKLLSFNGPRNLRRLCIYSSQSHFKNSKLFCPRLRSLLLFDPNPVKERMIDGSFIFRIFKLLKVLDIEQVHLSSNIPSEIGVLVQLRYLAIQCARNVSPAIGNLSNLITLVLRSSVGASIQLPQTFWNLRKLRHLYLSSSVWGIKLPVDNLGSSPNLYYHDQLISLSELECERWSILENQLRKFPNIRRLRFTVHMDREACELMTLSFLSRLESLHIQFGRCSELETEFVFPGNLKKLTLSGCELPWEKITTIAQLPHLEVLKLLDESFIGEIWDMEYEGEFSKLRYLKLSQLDVANWTASDDQFPNLQKLVLDYCHNLKEIPSDCLQNVPTLEMIEVFYCPELVANVLDQIQETQAVMGNSAFKVLVHY
ncbi:OLC1v1023723C1 [Oldenlandia corymbosa var. corymbosa]|uniref:OLC1v1023723C1 n=1 Tax=Oldenlandia corymbosa var. corymbosa TaxID=529605 RepID=A0AAV1C348_OLDCO|nr:OLC1v1023723C1 [Oldenlandia corymbosa var. corymbosa]